MKLEWIFYIVMILLIVLVIVCLITLVSFQRKPKNAIYDDEYELIEHKQKLERDIAKLIFEKMEFFEDKTLKDLIGMQLLIACELNSNRSNGTFKATTMFVMPDDKIKYYALYLEFDPIITKQKVAPLIRLETFILRIGTLPGKMEKVGFDEFMTREFQQKLQENIKEDKKHESRN